MVAWRTPYRLGSLSVAPRVIARMTSLSVMSDLYFLFHFQCSDACRLVFVQLNEADKHN